jgi:Ser/Thr protein kinase RdoA (MazF antagonist)
VQNSFMTRRLKSFEAKACTCTTGTGGVLSTCTTTCLASALIEDGFAPGFEAVRAALLDGYREHRPLAMRDVEMLPAFQLIRGMATIGWFHQRPEHAGSDFFEEEKNWVIAECDSNER